MKKSILIVALLAGCATSEKIIGPDGSPHHLITCNTVVHCYEKSRKICKGNYTIVNTSTQVMGVTNVPNSSTNLLIKCESPES